MTALNNVLLNMVRTVVSLTDTKIKSEINKHKKALDKIQKLSDGSGLFLLLDKKVEHIGVSIILSRLQKKNHNWHWYLSMHVAG